MRSLVPRRAKPAERLTLLVQALEALDRADDARRQLAGLGLLSKTPAAAMPHLHPLVKVEADARKEFRTLWLALGLQFASNIDGHHGDGWQGQPGVGLPADGERQLLSDSASQQATGKIRTVISPA